MGISEVIRLCPDQTPLLCFTTFLWHFLSADLPCKTSPLGQQVPSGLMIFTVLQLDYGKAHLYFILPIIHGPCVINVFICAPSVLYHAPVQSAFSFHSQSKNVLSFSPGADSSSVSTGTWITRHKMADSQLVVSVPLDTFRCSSNHRRSLLSPVVWLCCDCLYL